MIISDGRKQRLVQSYKTAAQIYLTYIGFIYEIYAEGHIYKVEFNKKDFLHLCGVTTNLSSSDFFENCIRSTITINNICTIQRKDWNSLKGKERCLLNLPHLITNPTDSLFLEDLVTSTFTFPVAIRNDDRNIAIAFKANNNYFARSLRKARHSMNCSHSYIIDKIYRYPKNDAQNRTLIYDKAKQKN